MNQYQNTPIGDYNIQTIVAKAPSIDGHVLHAIHALGMHRAIKIGAAGKEGRIRNEAHTLGSLDHPGIVTLCSTGDHHGAPYLVTAPYCQTTLETKIAERPLAWCQIRKLGIEALDALAHAHSRGILHLDLAPRHVLYSGDRAILCDFGAHRQTQISESLGSNQPLGSMPYMNTDQLSGKPPNAKMDLHALGKILAHAATGKLSDGHTEKPTDDPFMNALIERLIDPKGCQTAYEAYRLIEAHQPFLDGMMYENHLLRQHASKAQRALTYARRIDRSFIAASAGAGIAIGATLAYALVPLIRP